MLRYKKINRVAKKIHGENNTAIKFYLYDENLKIIVPY